MLLLSSSSSLLLLILLLQIWYVYKFKNSMHSQIISNIFSNRLEYNMIFPICSFVYLCVWLSFSFVCILREVYKIIALIFYCSIFIIDALKIVKDIINVRCHLIIIHIHFQNTLYTEYTHTHTRKSISFRSKGENKKWTKNIAHYQFEL